MNKAGSFALLTLFTLTSFLVGCPKTTTSTCADACTRGEICDDGECLPIARVLVEEGRTTGGVGLDLASNDDQLFISAIDPKSNEVLITTIDGEPDTRILHTFDDTVGAHTSVHANANRVGVVWREGSRFVYASRAVGALPTFWDVEEIEIEGSYLATEHFDLAIDASDEPHIVFHDATGPLFILDRETGTWRATLVDDGGPTQAGRGCDEIRERRNVGLDPHLLISNTLTVTYFDDVCGDLRIARFVEEGWVSDIVDEGLDLVQSETDRVGRFSSAARNVGGDLRISYFDETRGRLMLASETDGQFDISVIDEGLQIDNAARTRKLIVGAFTSIAVRPSGQQHVVYYDGTNGALRSARRETGDGSWTIETTDQNELAGMYAKIVVRGASFAVAYQRLTATEGELVSEQVWREVLP